MPTVLITGTSSGIGLAACELFAGKGWRVLAGSRNPDASLYKGKSIEPVRLDVNDPENVESFFREYEKHKMPLDCVVNNAGWGVSLPFEDTKRQEVAEMFQTNVFGLMEVTRHACRIMRHQKRGIIISVASIAGLVGSALYPIYVSTKFAVEGFSESLAHEMREMGVTVKIVEPGRVQTKFFDRAYAPIEMNRVSEPYKHLAERKLAQHVQSVEHYATAEQIAKVIFEAATDGTKKLRYPVGADALEEIKEKRTLTDQEFFEKMHEKFVG
ncbi:MAG: SDR family oxidoreductase [Candidatus Peribacteraceae bacterium]|nr:SDR family oxidoreductase [Candidatus Peribacteraceae bacterium]